MSTEFFHASKKRSFLLFERCTHHAQGLSAWCRRQSEGSPVFLSRDKWFQRSRQFSADSAMVLDKAYRQNFDTTINLLLHIAVVYTKEDRALAPLEAFGSRGGDGSPLFKRTANPGLAEEWSNLVDLVSTVGRETRGLSRGIHITSAKAKKNE